MLSDNLMLRDAVTVLRDVSARGGFYTKALTRNDKCVTIMAQGGRRTHGKDSDFEFKS